MSTAAVFYWGGEGGLDLHCVCGTPFPEQVLDDAYPARDTRRCAQCGATADLDEGTGVYSVRPAKAASA